MNADQMLSETRWIDSDLANSMEGVPCRTEFFRYIQWHNLAFSVTSDLNVPSYVFHYEDYSNRFDEVTTELIEFLELERKSDAPDFIDNKEYGYYYSREQKEAIAVMVKEFSTKSTWQHLHHYFMDSSGDFGATMESKQIEDGTDVIHKKRGVVSIV
jgi:hypothetical protein